MAWRGPYCIGLVSLWKSGAGTQTGRMASGFRTDAAVSQRAPDAGAAGRSRPGAAVGPEGLGRRDHRLLCPGRGTTRSTRLKTTTVGCSLQPPRDPDTGRRPAPARGAGRCPRLRRPPRGAPFPSQPGLRASTHTDVPRTLVTAAGCRVLNAALCGVGCGVPQEEVSPRTSGGAASAARAFARGTSQGSEVRPPGAGGPTASDSVVIRDRIGQTRTQRRSHMETGRRNGGGEREGAGRQERGQEKRSEQAGTLAAHVGDGTDGCPAKAGPPAVKLGFAA